MEDADTLIKQMNMISHPEGGHYVEVLKNDHVSQIYYLLKKNEKSHWHRLKKNEILHFYQGDPMLVYVSEDGLTSNTLSLGNDINNNENIHLVIKAGSWFSMKSKGKYSLIGCTVSPGFNYSDFELAPKNWEPG